jgi:hypothetical protein
MEKLWQYLQNQFVNATEGNYKKTVKLSNYHDADLNTKKVTEPLLVPIYARYHPLHVTLIAEYNAWKSASGSQKGKTSALELLLESTYLNMNGWDVAVQSQFLKGTPEYIAIFPEGRKPFTKGSVDDRINAYDTLSKNMLPYAALATLMSEVETAYTELDKARDAQEGSKGTVKTGSGKVEDARIAAMTMQYRDLGFAIDNFTDDTEYIESMFDLTTLRDKQQTHFTGTLDPSENHPVVTRTMLDDDQIKAKSNGTTNIKLYLASTPGGTNSTPVEVLANEEKTFTAADFGPIDFATHRYLTVVNQSPTNSTQFIIDLE